jgi:Ca2+-binding RTX toxin-like protein
MTHTQANAIDAANGSGVTTGTILNTTSVTDLATLTSTGGVGAYTITIAAGDATSAAANLLLIDAATSVAVGAANVTTVTGTATQVVAFATAEQAGTITAATNYAATITGSTTGANANTVDAANGDGAITILGTEAGETLDLTGATGPLVISGLAGNDVITGGGGADNITGGTGADNITGGAGVDTYVILAADLGDTITDFAVAEDRIDYNTALVAINSAGAVVYQAGAADTTLAVATTVFELTGITTAGSAANLVTALGTTATNADIDAADSILFVNYLAAGGAQVWRFLDANGANVEDTELTLLVTLTGVVADAVGTGNFI